MEAQGELEQIERIYGHEIYVQSHISFLSTERVLSEEKHFY